MQNAETQLGHTKLGTFFMAVFSSSVLVFLNIVIRNKGSCLWSPHPIPRCAPAALYLRQKISRIRTPMNELSEQDVTVDVCSRKQQTHCSGRVCKTIKFLKICSSYRLKQETFFFFFYIIRYINDN